MSSRCHLSFAGLAVLAALQACGTETPPQRSQAAAGASSGGTSGGSSSGGSASGGSAGSGVVGGNGGTSNSGGSVNGGSANGGTAGQTASGGAGGVANGGSGSGGTNTGGSGGAWPFPPSVTKPRIMIVGDSISAGPGCYKKYLVQNLNANGYTNFEFVGQYNDDCGGNVKHSAVSCSTAEQYTHAMFSMPNCSQGTMFPGMSTLMASHTPDLVMIQLGVNDVWNNTQVNTVLGYYQTLITQARAQNPNVVVVVAQISKIRPDCTNEAVTNLAQSLVNAVPGWAQPLSTPQSRVFTADLWTNSDWSMAKTIDCVHPNESGAMDMGLNWYNALKNILQPN